MDSKKNEDSVKEAKTEASLITKWLFWGIASAGDISIFEIMPYYVCNFSKIMLFFHFILHHLEQALK